MIYLFDLDLTIWDCLNKYGNPIWAKQMIEPFDGIKESPDVIIDDVYSRCTLRKGIRSYLDYLTSKHCQLGFISSGAYPALPFEKQPSVSLLKGFGIFKHFNSHKFLEYKTFNKASSIEAITEPITFFDDNDDILQSLSGFKNVVCVDSKTISDWSLLIGKHYD